MDTKEPLQFDIDFKKKKLTVCNYCGNPIPKKYTDGLPSFCSDICAVNAQPDKIITKKEGNVA